MAARSVPLVLPSNFVYNPATRSVTKDNARPATGVYIVDEGLSFLRALQGPLAVLSIAGRARTGKSTVLSRLLGRSDAFAVGNGQRPQTIGIWLACETLKCDGFQVVFLDCEGADSVHGSGVRDNVVYSLAMMLSSVFVYNTQGWPNAPDLDRLSFIAKLVQDIANKGGEKDIKATFPHFVWLIRDLNDSPKLHGADSQPVPCTWREYLLKEVLAQDESMDEEATSRNRIRKRITSSFASLDCFKLSYPCQPDRLAYVPATAGRGASSHIPR